MLDLLAHAAAGFGISVTKSKDRLACAMPVELVGGRKQVFRLEVTLDNGTGQPQVQEIGGALPSFCPQRHINRNGTFCLGWGEDVRIVECERSAEAWWAGVHQYLQLQMRASRTKQWQGREWAHGVAAHFQARAEQAARALGPDVIADLEAGRIQAHREQRTDFVDGERVVQVVRSKSEWIRAWEKKGRVVNARLVCACSEGNVKHHRGLRTCGDHAKQATELALALIAQADEERKFWDVLAGTNCCGTMRTCPLRLTNMK